MSSQPQKPSLVFVPGAWHRPSTWDKVVKPLEAQGYKCTCVTLPSTSGKIVTGLWNDIKAIRDAIEAETTHGRDVVLVVHSYGGAVGASAVKGFAKSKDDISTTSTTGHVIGFAGMATGFGPSGIGFLEATGGKPPPSWKADTETGYATIVADARELFYHDLPEEEGKYWVSQLTPQALAPLAEDGTHAYAGWQDVPCWYLMTVEDRALPVEIQKMMIEYVKGTETDITVREVASSHSPMLSQPEVVVEFVRDAAEYFAGKAK